MLLDESSSDEDILEKEEKLCRVERKKFEAQANDNDAEALFRLGHCCLFGGLTLCIDKQKAKEYLIKSCDLGFGPSLALYARILKDEKSDLCEEYGAKALETGDDLAAGLCCDFGLGTKVDEEKAFKSYEKASQGNVVAMNSLGVCYANGEGVEQNDEKAFQCYKNAAERGLGIAKVRLWFSFSSIIGII